MERQVIGLTLGEESLILILQFLLFVNYYVIVSQSSLWLLDVLPKQCTCSKLNVSKQIA